MINQAMNHIMNSINAIDNRIALIGGSMVLGYLLIPLALRVAKVALDVFIGIVLKSIDLSAKAFKWVLDSTVIMNIRALGCHECADHHRNHV